MVGGKGHHALPDVRCGKKSELVPDDPVGAPRIHHGHNHRKLDWIFFETRKNGVGTRTSSYDNYLFAFHQRVDITTF